MINEFLENQVVQTWIAPIITTSIVGLVSFGVNIFRKRRDEVKNINKYLAAEEKMIEIIRPFFIQELKLNKAMIEDARSGIIKEFELIDESFIKIEDIKNIIILDILKTRFIKEENKQKLIDNLYDVFNEDSLENTKYIQDSNIYNYKDILNKSNIMIKKYNDTIFMTLSLIAALICAILPFIKYEKISENVILYNNMFTIGLLLISIGISILFIICIIPDIFKKKVKNREQKLKNMKEQIKEDIEKIYKSNKDNL